jgi:uncharacterized protein
MAGGTGDPERADVAHRTIIEMGFSILAFEERCIEVFSQLRSEYRLKAPDSSHLACAAVAGVDMFLTGDVQLLKRGLHVPEIHFIVDFNLPVLNCLGIPHASTRRGLSFSSPAK